MERSSGKEQSRANGLNQLLSEIYKKKIKAIDILRNKGFSENDLEDIRNKLNLFLDGIVNQFSVILSLEDVQLIVCLYGLNTGEPDTIDEIAASLSLSKEKIKKLQQTVIKRLKEKIEIIIVSAASTITGRTITQKNNIKLESNKDESINQNIKINLNNILISFAKDKVEFFAFNNYISQSKIEKFKNDYKKHYLLIKSLLAEDSISNIDKGTAKELVATFDNIIKLSEEQNNKFIEQNLKTNKEYFDNLLRDVDSNVMLDEEQRRAILTDEDYCLLIAGAGAGKTTTMAAKVKYLTEIQKIRPQDIVVISYTNKAIDELKERIQNRLKIQANITTFHKFGYDLLRDSSEDVPTVEYFAAHYIFDCLEKQIFNNKPLLRKVMLFLGYYLNIPEEALKFENLNSYFNYKADSYFQTIRSDAGDFIKKILDKRKQEKRTVTGEYVRSNQEVQIANFLYLNGIEYEYEKRYPYQVKDSKKVYIPDFTIIQNKKIYYLEHFGISENYLNTRFSNEELEKYKNSIILKRKLHKENNTQLIETFSEYNDRRELKEHLKEQLLKYKIKIKPRSDEEIYKKIISTSKDKYVYRFGYLILDFIGRYKEFGYDKDGFEILRQKQDNVRTNLFLEIVEEIYNYYQEQLRTKNSVDFPDMINNAEHKLREAEKNNIYLPYKYIIIDEFQDIARQRFNLTKTLANITGAKIVAVGDDWQSIFAFAGSDITLFQKFLELMGQGIEMQINHTYRNSQELIDIAGNFIQKNPTQIKKRLISPKSIKEPIEIVEYDREKKGEIQKRWIEAIDGCVEKIINEFGEKSTILLISRYNYEKNKLCDSNYFYEGKNDKIIWKKNKKINITCLTAHSSKGLGFDNVIILNMIETRFGFPSQLDDDPILKLVTTQDLSIPYAEERRLFYVALTRTKNKVFLVTPSKSPSRFVLELVKNYNIKHSENLSFEIRENNKLQCPLCKASLKYQPNNEYGLPLYMCTNDPEICDFMTNSKKVLADIFKCKECNDGYMIVKESKKHNDFFYGCTEYPNCNNQEKIPDNLKKSYKDG